MLCSGRGGTSKLENKNGPGPQGPGARVVGTRNDLLRFWFRLWKSLGSGSVSAPDPDLLSAVFQQQQKFEQNL